MTRTRTLDRRAERDAARRVKLWRPAPDPGEPALPWHERARRHQLAPSAHGAHAYADHEEATTWHG